MSNVNTCAYPQVCTIIHYNCKVTSKGKGGYIQIDKHRTKTDLDNWKNNRNPPVVDFRSKKGKTMIGGACYNLKTIYKMALCFTYNSTNFFQS